VPQRITPPGIPDHTLKDVCNDDKQIGGEWIPLPKSITTANPVPRDPVEKDSRVPRLEDPLHPEAPAVVKTSGTKNCNEASPIYRVKGLSEIDFENNSGGLSGVANAEQIRGVNDVFRDTAARKEPSLIRIDKGVNVFLESRRENLSDSFHDAVLEGDGPKLRRMAGGFRFWEEHKEGPVDTREVNGAIVEGGEDSSDIGRHKVPEGGEESRTKPVRPRAGKFVHADKGGFYLVWGERRTEAAAKLGVSG
jgi:hypothetical protein